jgi:hypothetical protein
MINTFLLEGMREYRKGIPYLSTPLASLPNDFV